jgi:hypothetical protein
MTAVGERRSRRLGQAICTWLPGIARSSRRLIFRRGTAVSFTDLGPSRTIAGTNYQPTTILPLRQRKVTTISFSLNIDARNFRVGLKRTGFSVKSPFRILVSLRSYFPHLLRLLRLSQ